MATLFVYGIWLGVFMGVIGTAEMIAEKVMDKKKAHRRQPVSKRLEKTNLNFKVARRGEIVK